MIPGIFAILQQVKVLVKNTNDAVGGLDTGDLERILQITVDTSATSSIWGDSSDGVGPATTTTLPSALVQYSSWTINAGNTITCAASPQIIKVNGTLTINGTLAAAQTGRGRLLIHYADANGARASGGNGGTTSLPVSGVGGGVAALAGGMLADCPSDFLFGSYLEGGKGGDGVSDISATAIAFAGEDGVGAGGGGGARGGVTSAITAGGLGGGSIVIIAKSVVISATGIIQSIGVNGISGNAGGGGGGGGSIITLTNSLTVTPGGIFKSEGGIGGNGTGSGGAGGSTTTINGPAVAGSTGSGTSGGGGSTGLIVTRLI